MPERRKPTSFLDKVVIVTGGASGIGRALGEALTEQGAQVVFADIETRPGVTECDVRDEASVRAVVDEVVDRHGRIDLMFNNAGVSIGGPTHDLLGAHWQRAIDVNITGVVNGVLAAYPRMVEQGYGHIVNTASVAGLAPAVMTVPYSTTKHAVVGLSATLRPEAAMHGVRVSALCPGAVDTPILDGSQPTGLPERPGVLTGREYIAKLGLKPMPPRTFAEGALRGVARNRAVIVVPASARAPWYLQRYAPGLMDRVGGLTARRVQRAMEKLAP